jgi:hypothetical protein
LRAAFAQAGGEEGIGFGLFGGDKLAVGGLAEGADTGGEEGGAGGFVGGQKLFLEGGGEFSGELGVVV